MAGALMLSVHLSGETSETAVQGLHTHMLDVVSKEKFVPSVILAFDRPAPPLIT